MTGRRYGTNQLKGGVYAAYHKRKLCRQPKRNKIMVFINVIVDNTIIFLLLAGAYIA